MQCPICNDPLHVEKIRELMEGRFLMWCPECDQFFFATRFWWSGEELAPTYRIRLCDAETATACQDATD